jgi:hypothetical protein
MYMVVLAELESGKLCVAVTKEKCSGLETATLKRLHTPV